ERRLDALAVARPQLRDPVEVEALRRARLRRPRRDPPPGPPVELLRREAEVVSGGDRGARERLVDLAAVLDAALDDGAARALGAGAVALHDHRADGRQAPRDAPPRRLR